jgi:nudix-type nucleoside diphosphatase (YffH/AdpP family)
MATYRIQDVTTLHRGRRSLLKLTIQFPDGQRMEREVLESPPAVGVLPYDPERRKAILLRQFRAPVLYDEGEPYLTEAIAGLVNEDESIEACVRREAMEEAGLRLSTLEPVCAGWSTPGFTTERAHLFLAPYAPADRVSRGGGLPEEHEEIEVQEIGIDELADRLERSAIPDLKTLALVQALRLRHRVLFELT